MARIVGLALALALSVPGIGAPVIAQTASDDDAAATWHDDGDDDERRSNRAARRRAAAVKACREEALSGADDLGLIGRVSQINGVDQVGRRYRVRGVFVDETYPRQKQRLRFVCVARPGVVESFDYRDPIRRPWRPD